MSAAQIAQARIKELEQQLAETQIAAEGFRAQLMATRDEMITARHTFQGREQGWKLQLAEVLGAEVMEVREGIQALAAQYRKLLDGYPNGMTPTDVEKLKAANAGLAEENERVLFANRYNIDMYNQANEAWQATVAQSARMRSALEYSNSYLCASQLNTIGHGSKAHIKMKDALEEEPAQSLAEIQTEAARAARSNLCIELAELFESDQLITAEQVVDLIAAPDQIALREKHKAQEQQP